MTRLLKGRRKLNAKLQEKKICSNQVGGVQRNITRFKSILQVGGVFLFFLLIKICVRALKLGRLNKILFSNQVGALFVTVEALTSKFGLILEIKKRNMFYNRVGAVCDISLIFEIQKKKFNQVGGARVFRNTWKIGLIFGINGKNLFKSSRRCFCSREL